MAGTAYPAHSLQLKLTRGKSICQPAAELHSSEPTLDTKHKDLRAPSTSMLRFRNLLPQQEGTPVTTAVRTSTTHVQSKTQKRLSARHGEVEQGSAGSETAPCWLINKGTEKSVTFHGHWGICGVTRLPSLCCASVTGVLPRRTTGKVSPDSEIKLCAEVGAVEGSRNML